jgi:hypothetical protein
MRLASVSARVFLSAEERQVICPGQLLMPGMMAGGGEVMAACRPLPGEMMAW